MLFELIHRDVGAGVVHLQDLDEVRDREHPDELLPLRVPQRGRSDACARKRQLDVW